MRKQTGKKIKKTLKMPSDSKGSSLISGIEDAERFAEAARMAQLNQPKSRFDKIWDEALELRAKRQQQEVLRAEAREAAIKDMQRNDPSVTRKEALETLSSLGFD